MSSCSCVALNIVSKVCVVLFDKLQICATHTLNNGLGLGLAADVWLQFNHTQ